MSRLVESIKIQGGKIWNAGLHEARANRSRGQLFGTTSPLGLAPSIQPYLTDLKGTYKCRVLFRESVEDIQLTPYSIRIISSAMLVTADGTDYPHKYEDRSQLDALFSLRGSCDEIILVKNGLITDAYYYNLLFEKNGRLFTPATPVLMGIQRQKLISKGLVTETDIPATEIGIYDRIHFINALTLPGKVVLTPDKVSRQDSKTC